MKHEAAYELILDYMDGELTGGRLGEFESHMDSCDQCRAELVSLKAARQAASFLKAPVEPSAGIDRAILAEARLAATRNRGLAQEADQKKKFSLRSLFSPALLTSMAVILVIGYAVFYLPQDKALNEVMVPTNNAKQDAPSEFEADSDEAETAIEMDNLKSVGFVADSDGEERRAEPPTAGLVSTGDLKDQDGREKRTLDGVTTVDESPDLKEAINRRSLPTVPKLEKKSPTRGMEQPAAEPEDTPVAAGAQPGRKAEPAPHARARSDADPVISEGTPESVEESLDDSLDDSTMAVGGNGSSQPAKSTRKPKARNAAPAPPALESSPDSDAAEDAIAGKKAGENKNASETARSIYRQAKRLEKMGKYGEAVKKYNTLLNKYPEFRNSEVKNRLRNAKAKQLKAKAANEAMESDEAPASESTVE